RVRAGQATSNDGSEGAWVSLPRARVSEDLDRTYSKRQGPEPNRLGPCRIGVAALPFVSFPADAGGRLCDASHFKKSGTSRSSESSNVTGCGWRGGCCGWPWTGACPG